MLTQPPRNKMLTRHAPDSPVTVKFVKSYRGWPAGAVVDLTESEADRCVADGRAARFARPAGPYSEFHAARAKRTTPTEPPGEAESEARKKPAAQPAAPKK